jgi:hypothetical protein
MTIRVTVILNNNDIPTTTIKNKQREEILYTYLRSPLKPESWEQSAATSFSSVLLQTNA